MVPPMLRCGAHLLSCVLVQLQFELVHISAPKVNNCQYGLPILGVQETPYAYIVLASIAQLPSRPRSRDPADDLDQTAGESDEELEHPDFRYRDRRPGPGIWLPRYGFHPTVVERARTPAIEARGAGPKDPRCRTGHGVRRGKCGTEVADMVPDMSAADTFRPFRAVERIA
ncbi:hypothetical protein GCM10011588_16650 [Nocardia jinanensis]|uniref:Uncharacterized protein n=1 Tax=Nocardia jinanensis TaxID=382504 RepID=A0A917RDV6_9NOCA|nr:hypothetical protein GCM10011588_16650 [Nocardia jinanensis]